MNAVIEAPSPAIVAEFFAARAVYEIADRADDAQYREDAIAKREGTSREKARTASNFDDAQDRLHQAVAAAGLRANGGIVRFYGHKIDTDIASFPTVK
jgi:uncharacterized protein (DUF3084 family)